VKIIQLLSINILLKCLSQNDSIQSSLVLSRYAYQGLPQVLSYIAKQSLFKNIIVYILIHFETRLSILLHLSVKKSVFFVFFFVWVYFGTVNYVHLSIELNSNLVTILQFILMK
jgi:hypothetical protein